MSVRVRSALQRAFYPATIASILVALVLAALLVGTFAAIKGGYALLGVALAYMVSKRRLVGEGAVQWFIRGDYMQWLAEGSRVRRLRKRSRNSLQHLTEVPPRIYAKLLISAWLVGFTVAVMSGTRLYGLVLCLPIGYLLLGVQFRLNATPLSLLAQLTLLFSFGPLTKYLNTGFYVGNGDIFDHLELLEELAASGSISALGRYADFPLYHLFINTASDVSGLAMYATMMLVQIVSYLLLLTFIFLLARTLTSQSRFACLVALAASVVFYFSYYATLIFPQSITTVLVITLLYIAFRATNPETHAQFVGIGVLIGLTIVLMHHLTLLLFAPAIALALIGTAAARRTPILEQLKEWRHQPRPYLLYIPGAIAGTYWVYQRGFLSELSHFIRRYFVETVFLTEEEFEASIYALGMTVPNSGLKSTVWSVFSPEGIYFIVLVMVFTLGVEQLLEEPPAYSSVVGFCIVGVLGSVLVLRTPIAVDHVRLRLPFALFFAFVVTFGFHTLESRERHNLVPIFMIVLIVLGSLAPVVAGDDLYETGSDESLYEQRPLPEPIFEFTTAEYLQLETASEIAQTNSDGAASFRNTEKALSFHGLEEKPDLEITNDGMNTEAELIVYHDRWPDHRHVTVGEDRHATVLVSEEWLEQTTATENQIYSSGDTGILWREDGGTFGEESSAIVDTDE